MVFWISLLILLTKWPRVRNRSVSQHSAAFKESYRFFTTVQVIVGIITYIFVIRWFIPTFDLTLLFTIIYTLMALLQISSALIPDTMTGRSSKVHLFLANYMALGMFFAALLLCFSPAIHGLSKIVVIVTTLYMLVCGLVIAQKKGRPHLLPNYLIIQIIYIVGFQATMLFVSLYR